MQWFGTLCMSKTRKKQTPRPLACEGLERRELLAADIGCQSSVVETEGSSGSTTTALREYVGTPLRSSGDANGDGIVDAADLNIVGQNWQKTFASVRPAGDFNGDFTVDSADLNILALNWGKNVSVSP